MMGLKNFYKDGDNPFMIDLTEYGALNLPRGISQTFEMKNGGFFNFDSGVYVVRDVVEEMVGVYEADGEPPPPPRYPVEHLLRMCKTGFLTYINEVEEEDDDIPDWTESSKVMYCVLKSIQQAIRRYHTQKHLRLLRTYVSTLVCMNHHYKVTMEKSYRPGGAGYIRVMESTMVGIAS